MRFDTIQRNTLIRTCIAGYERGLCVYKALGLKEPKGKRLAETAPLSFVAGITLVTSALCSGETIYLVPNETIRDPNLLSEYFYKNKIDIAFIPPKLLKVFDNKDKHLQIVHNPESYAVSVHPFDPLL